MNIAPPSTSRWPFSLAAGAAVVTAAAFTIVLAPSWARTPAPDPEPPAAEPDREVRAAPESRADPDAAFWAGLDRGPTSKLTRVTDGSPPVLLDGRLVDPDGPSGALAQARLDGWFREDLLHGRESLPANAEVAALFDRAIPDRAARFGPEDAAFAPGGGAPSVLTEGLDGPPYGGLNVTVGEVSDAPGGGGARHVLVFVSRKTNPALGFGGGSYVRERWRLAPDGALTYLETVPWP